MFIADTGTRKLPVSFIRRVGLSTCRLDGAVCSTDDGGVPGVVVPILMLPYFTKTKHCMFMDMFSKLPILNKIAKCLTALMFWAAQKATKTVPEQEDHNVLKYRYRRCIGIVGWAIM
jgi:hypothetical protein